MNELDQSIEKEANAIVKQSWQFIKYYRSVFRTPFDV